jgi:Fe2+ or Zn2+ uptake regulation protein
VEPHAIEAFTRKTRQDHDFRIDLEHLTIPGLCSSCVEAPVV